MSLNHKAIYTLYPQVVTIHDSTGAFDKDGKKVNIDLALVNSWVDPEKYKSQRQLEYPSIEEQLDTLYHGGLAEWKASIKAVKDKYPKP